MSDYSLPAEWAKQDAIMLTWPHSATDWAPMLAEVTEVYRQLTKEIASRQQLVIICHDAQVQRQVEAIVAELAVPAGRIHLVQAPCNDTWARDHGPITVLDKNGNPCLLDFTFTAWGDKFAANLDNNINQQLFQADCIADIPKRKVELVLEGGGIESDGKGSLLVTKKCLLNPNRNPELNQAEIEQQLCQQLGMQRVLWLEHGYLAGDDTDAHIDTLVRFAPDDTLVYVSCDDPKDEHFRELQAMAHELTDFKTLDGKPYHLIPLPWPAAKFNADGERLPASYANYLIMNDAVLVPTYHDSQDTVALAQIQRAYPQHQVIGVHCLPLIHQYGSLHCVTMQLPAGVLHRSI
ncbi:agmatine deiminase family protein [Alkalimonas sp. NCh-2]|uniref:agmatine deiminase family protein n=1 Tax=Alkalimonas sp. NCh-2 TaxID=3144846 RepID=UPI0031F6E4D4